MRCDSLVRLVAVSLCALASSTCIGQEPIPAASDPAASESPPAAAVPNSAPPSSFKSHFAPSGDAALPGYFLDPQTGMAMPGGAFPYAVPELVPDWTVAEGFDFSAFWYRGQKMAYSEELLPAANEANDLFHAQLDPTDLRMGAAWTPLTTLLAVGAPESSQDIWSRFGALPNFGAAFDSGFVDGGVFDARKIAPGKHPAAGQTRFTGGDFQEVPVSLLFDNQVRNLEVLGAEQVQVYLEANNHFQMDRLRLEHLYARAWNGERLTIGAGKTYSLFSTGGVSPATLSQASTLVGTGGLDKEGRAQLRLQRSVASGGGLGMGVAIEDPYAGDFVPPGGATTLTRWPTLAGNLLLKGDNDVDWLQLSALVRTLGFQDSAGVEHFETAWGLSAYARLATIIDQDRVGGFFVGIAGGEGVGQYVHGVGTSAVFDSGFDRFSTVEGLGAYIGYQRQWVTAGNWEMGANLAYGYAMLDAPAFMPALTNEELHQAWANLIVYPNKNVAIGLEYHYGDRETLAAGNGENHRFMLVVALTTGKAETASTRGFLRGYEHAPSAAARAFAGEPAEQPRSQASRQSL